MADVLTKAARNERRKLKANTSHAAGLAIVGIGVNQPLMAGQFDGLTLARMVAATLIGYILREHSIWLLGDLED